MSKGDTKMSRKFALATVLAGVVLSGAAVTVANAEDVVPSIFFQPNATRTQVAEACHTYQGAGEGFNGSGAYDCFTTVGYIVCNADGKCRGGPYAQRHTGKFVGLFKPDQSNAN